MPLLEIRMQPFMSFDANRSPAVSAKLLCRGARNSPRELVTGYRTYFALDVYKRQKYDRALVLASNAESGDENRKQDEKKYHAQGNAHAPSVL